MSRSAPRTAEAAPDLTSRLAALRDALLVGLVERDVAIRLALLAALSGEHLLLLGPPGTAKSLVGRRLRTAVAESTYFERLLTRFTVPEELFGPLSIKGLEEDRYERLTSSYLPTASVAFLDEIFKANSAILNALLTLLNEREFDNGTRREKTPLVSVVGASDEVPEGPELDALFDLFLLRLHVGAVSQRGFDSLIALRGQPEPDVPEAAAITGAEFARIRTEAERVELPEDVVGLLKALRDWCAAERLAVSDRRWRKVVKLLQVSALTNGRSRVSVWDCWLLQHCVGETPEQAKRVYDWYAARVGASAAMDPARLTKIVVSWEATLKRDQDSRSQARDAKGRPLYRDFDGSLTAGAQGRVRRRRGGDDLYLAPADAKQEVGDQRNRYADIADRTNGGRGYTVEELDELCIVDSANYRRVADWSRRDAYLVDPSSWLMSDGDLAEMIEPTRHKSIYVDGCLRELDDVRAKVVAYQEKLLAHVASLEREVQRHLWVPAEFAKPALENLGKTFTDVSFLLDRVAKLRQGYELLPRERAVGEPLARASDEDEDSEPAGE